MQYPHYMFLSGNYYMKIEFEEAMWFLDHLQLGYVASTCFVMIFYFFLLWLGFALLFFTRFKSGITGFILDATRCKVEFVDFSSIMRFSFSKKSPFYSHCYHVAP